MAEKKEIAGIKLSTILLFVTTTLATIFVVVGIINYDKTNVSNTQVTETVQTTESTQTTETSEVTMVSYQGEDGKTALQLLKVNADTTTEQSSLGEYVTAINGEDGGGTKYWLYYVNDEPATVGAGDYVTQDSDEIDWRLE